MSLQAAIEQMECFGGYVAVWEKFVTLQPFERRLTEYKLHLSRGF
jgi:hypothetical protein